MELPPLFDISVSISLDVNTSLDRNTNFTFVFRPLLTFFTNLPSRFSTNWKATCNESASQFLFRCQLLNCIITSFSGNCLASRFPIHLIKTGIAENIQMTLFSTKNYQHDLA